MARPGLAAGPIPILPTSVIEGAGVLTQGGRVDLGGTAASNLVVTLKSSDPVLISLPAEVTILSGESSALFDLTVGDNLVAEGNHDVTVTASTDVSTNTTTVLVIESDPDHIQFAAVPAVAETNAGFYVQVTALNADGTVQTNFNRSLTMTAVGIEGVLPLASTNSGQFFSGRRNVPIQVTVPGHGVRIGSQEYPGQSDAFTVVPPAFHAVSQPVADIVWDQVSGTLLASVPASGGVYSNSIVAIDPESGLATNSYPVGYNPGQMEISPGGGYLYVALDDGTKLQRFDLSSRLAGAPFALGTNSNPVRFAYDFCVPPGMADSVVVAARLRDNIGNTSVDGIYRYDSGSMVSLPNFSASGGWLVESMGTGYQVALSPPLAIGNAASGTIVASSANFLGKAVIYRGGRFFDDRGNCYSSGDLGLLGTYPGLLDQLYYVALPETDPVSRRTFYLSGYFNYGYAMYKLKVYDRDLYQPLFQLAMPPTTGSPMRLVRCDTNFLAYVTGDNQLWLIRPDATQPTRPPADLTLSVSAPGPAPIAGSDYSFSLTLSNTGPGVASVIEVTNALPTNTVVVQALQSTGTVTVTSSAFTWNVADLGAGSNATLELTVRFNNGGWQTNTTWALGFESDPVFTNNIVTLPVYVQLPQQAFGVFAVNYATRDLLYDPARDRLLLSVTNGPAPGQGNGLVVFDPYTGVSDSFTPLGQAPARMARSDDGQFLYVSLPDAGTVRQFDLQSLTPNYSFAIGGEVIYGQPYTNYAHDLAVVPGKPDSVVAWTVRHANGGSLEFGYGIALYQDGVMASNVTDTGGSWQVAFDTDTGTLFGYNAGDLRRCSLDSNGVSFVEQYPTLYAAGTEIAYGGGHLFNSGGEMLSYNPFQVDWIFAGAQGAALVVPDPVTDRVFYLVKNGNWQINAYDIPSRRLLGSIAIPNLVGTPSRLIRWGADGLAFQTTGNQLFIIRSPLVRTDTYADLALTLTTPTGQIPPGTNVTFTVNVANQGTIQATNLVITNSLSPGTALLSVSPGAGTWSTNSDGRTIVWTLGALDTGAQATLSYTVTTLQTGIVTALATATTSTFDPMLANNTAVATVLVGAPLTLDGSLSFQLPANDLVWSPSLDRFLVTANAGIANWGGALLSVDPASLGVQFQAGLGADAGRLALSRDDSVLYAGTDLGVATVTIPALAVTNRFVINPTSPGAYAYDIRVAPGKDEVVAIGARSPSNNSTWVTAFDRGRQLTNTDSFYSTSMNLVFGDQASSLFACNGSSFNRYALDTNGVSLLDSTPNLFPAGTPVDLVWGNGLVYSSVGNVVNPFSAALQGIIAGIPSGSRVAYDTASGWVFYLSPGAGQAVLRAFDGATLLPAGARTIPGIGGSITRFVRWGADGFAAITSSNQLVLFRSSLVPTNPPADLSVSLAYNQGPYFQGSNIAATIIVSNAGPNTATSVAWSNLLPAGVTLVNVDSSLGSLTTNSSSVAGEIPLLAAGSAATVRVTFSVPSSGIVSNQVLATASSIDPDFSNNTAVSLLWIQPANETSDLLSLTLSVKDLEPDPVRPVIYASVGSNGGALANSIVTIDPVNETIGTPVPVGSDPGRLAVSADGRFLYVALDGARTVQKLSLPDLATVSSFPVPQNQTVFRMKVCPTNSDMVVIRRSPAGRTSLHVDGAERPNELSMQDLFAFLDTGELFGCDGFHSNVKLYALDTGPTGLLPIAGQPGKQSNASDLRASGGLLFFSGGMVVNPITTRVVDWMPVPYNSVVCPDAGCGRVFYLIPAGNAWTLHAFDIDQGIDVGAVSLPPLASAPQKLLRWGADGLALYTTNSQVVILRDQLVPTNPPVDVVLHQSINPSTATISDTLDFSLRLTNLGPVTASGVVVTQSFSSDLINVGVSTSLGAAAYTNGTMVWQVGDLSTGVVATLTISGRATRTGTLLATAQARHDLNDVFWGNNVAIGGVNIQGTNGSGPVMIRLAARELMYDPARDLIYASTAASNQLAGNLIAKIDPATGTLRDALPAGSEPDRIALSDDGTYLHVALNGAMGVRRFNLASNIEDLDFSFATNDIDYAQDLVVQPGHPETVAASLGSYNYVAGYPSTVLAYDDGVPRPNPGGPARGLTFSADGTTLFGYISPGISYGVKRMTLQPQGFSTTGMGGFTAVPGNLQYSNGRLYSAAGQVEDANAGVLIGTMAASGPQAIDTEGGRAFYLTQSGASWQIRAFDLATLQSSGTQTVAGVQGTPSSLIRCGGDRLGFCTSAGQVFIVQSPLVPTNPVSPANLAVSQRVEQDFTTPEATLRFVMSVTNRGPGAASNVIFAINPPASVASVTLQLLQGSSTIDSSGNYRCDLGSLVPGQGLDFTLSAVITNTASYSNFASVSAATPDPDLSDNTSLASYQGRFFQGADSVQIYTSTARTLAYDPLRQRLFAALAPDGTTNLLAWYDPESGALLGTMPVGLAADTMRVTDDGQFLYLGAGSTGLVQRIELSSLNVDLSFAPPQTTALGAMAILPGSPHSIALTSWSNNIPVTAIYDDGVARTNPVTTHPFTMLAASTDGTTLYGYANTGTGANAPRVFRMAITGSGLQEVDSGPSEVPPDSTVMKYALNRLFFGSGAVLDPTPWNLEQPFTLTNGWGPGSIEPLPQPGLAAFLQGDLYNYNLAHLGVCSISNRSELQQFDIRTSVAGNGSLTWCGADRFAFVSGAGIVFVRSSAVPAADIAARAFFSTNQVMAGDPVTLQIVMTNAGPYAVTNVCVTNTLPDGFHLLSVTASQGTIATNGQTLVGNLGALGAYTNATLNLAMSQDGALVNFVTNAIVVTDGVNGAATDLPDPVPFNNSAAAQLVVVPRDSNGDGIPDYWDLRYGFNPNDPNVASQDAAGDGISNLQKFLAGADPFAFYGLSITGWKYNRPTDFYLTVHGAVGRTYALESSPDLAHWTVVSTFLCQSTNQQVRALFDPAVPSAFYRLSSTTNAPVPLIALLNPSAVTTHAPVLQVAAPAGYSYTLYVSTNLVDWTVLTNFYATYWATQTSDPSANGAAVRFYRVASP